MNAAELADPDSDSEADALSRCAAHPDHADDFLATREKRARLGRLLSRLGRSRTGGSLGDDPVAAIGAQRPRRPRSLSPRGAIHLSQVVSGLCRQWARTIRFPTASCWRGSLTITRASTNSNGCA